jgi:ABC-2 type transport system ATP-binding protein
LQMVASRMAPSTLPMIKAANLHKYFADIRAVDDVSFVIGEGEIYGLLGPNGAGKTTTINMLAGALHPDSGSVSIGNGSDPTQAEVRRQLGSAPQALAIYDDLTAAENVTFFGKLYGLGGRRLKERVASCLELVGLTERRKSRVSTFSGGMKRRLNLACALVHEPPVLLLDEPTVGVDPQSRNLIFDRIETLRKEGLTLLYTTHYMEEAQRLCDRVAIMDHGKILAEGTVDELIAAHGGKGVVYIDLEEMPASDVRLPAEPQDLHLRFESSQPMEDVAALNSKGVKFRTLRVERADLESVFLNLTGRSLRD